jgi:hypothetical protein
MKLSRVAIALGMALTLKSDKLYNKNNYRK